MERKVRIIDIEKQDELRREDAAKLTPTERMLALMKMRDSMFPYQPLKRIVTVRKLF